MFKLLAHTADIGLTIIAPTPEKLFRSALMGMAFIQKKNFCKHQEGIFFSQERIQVLANDQTNLLIDFLSEALTLSHINKVIYCEVNFHKLTDTSLIATIKGNRVNYFDEDIKAVTYHEAKIKQTVNKQFETVVIFDI